MVQLRNGSAQWRESFSQAELRLHISFSSEIEKYQFQTPKRVSDWLGIKTVPENESAATDVRFSHRAILIKPDLD